MNKSDSEKIARFFEKSGYQPASNINEADLVVVNMCSVRQSAVNRVYGTLEKIKSQKLKVKSILTGCILRKDRKKFEKYFNLVLDIKDLRNWPIAKTHDREIFAGKKPMVTAYVPIITGCNNFCSYCIVPYIRGREISLPAEEIICEVKKLVKKGIKEIWLLGQNVNSYKGIFEQKKIKPQKIKLKSTPIKYDRINCESDFSFNFPQLLKQIDKISGKFWIRFTSSHPKDFSDDLIKVMKSCRKVTPYLNLPVQAGDDEILKKMNRPYTIAQYKKIIKKIRKKIPDICLSTDVIVGFPDETKKQFENTVKLFKEIKYDMAYISEYSPRPGTAGAKLFDNISLKEKKRRKKALNEILKKTALENNKKYIGKTIKVLITGKNIGKTITNKTVRIITQNLKFKSKNFIGRFVKIKIIAASSWSLKGEHVK